MMRRTVLFTQVVPKVPKFSTPEIFAVIYLKFKERGEVKPQGILSTMMQRSEDPDQTAPLGATSHTGSFTVCPDLRV